MIGTVSSSLDPKFPSLAESVLSSDTCIFSTPAKKEENTADELKSKLEEIKVFAKSALSAQKKYFEDIIAELEQEILDDREFFTKEIGLLREEINEMHEERDELSTIFSDNLSPSDYKTQYFRNQEQIALLERQNQALYEKIISDISEPRNVFKK